MGVDKLKLDQGTPEASNYYCFWFIIVTLHAIRTLAIAKAACLSSFQNTVKPVYNSPVYSGHPVYYSHWKTFQNFQLPYIFCKVDLYIYSGHPVYNAHLAISQG